MSEQTNTDQAFRLEIGMPVDSTDEHWGSLHDVVVDPRHWKVTHLILKPRFHHHGSWLVPIDTVVACDRRITLSLSDDEIVACPQVEVTDFVRVGPDALQDSTWATGTPTVLAWPYYPGLLVGASPGAGFSYGQGHSYGSSVPAVVTTRYDRLPNDTIEIRRDSRVITVDDHEVGHVDGFVIKPDGTISHLVLQKGHFWGHREITIPLADVSDATMSTVHLSVSRDAIADYPEVEVRRHSVVSPATPSGDLSEVVSKE